jgi:hypothetical protein
MDTDSWRPYICSATRGRVFLSPRLALFVDAAVLEEVAPASDAALLAPALVGRFLAALEGLLARFDAVVGKAPPLTHAHEGRQHVEVAHLPGAAGLAHHGRAGFAVGPAFLRESLQSFAAAGREPFIHHVFGYEASRNYIFPEEFTPPFKYSCAEGPECWGWLNQGFVNIMGCLLLADRPGGVGFSYFGHSAAAFRSGMEGHLLFYIARRAGLQCGAPRSGGGEACGFAEAFLHERLPWAPHQSLDNLFSGIISVLFRAHGGARFLRGVFRALPHLRARLPAHIFDHGVACENIVAACSVGAREDLSPFFGGLGFPVGAAQSARIAALLAACAN